MDYQKAPFPYFGGKSKVAHIIWQALGDVKHYLEPFFGSGAVLISRPNYNPEKHVETVCDKNGYIANVWRALKHAPDEVAKYADEPVNHLEMAVRNNVLHNCYPDLIKKLAEDENYYDAKLAGYWIWGQCCSIGLDFGGREIKTEDNPKKQLLTNIGEIKLGRRPHINREGNRMHSISMRDINFGRRPYTSTEGQGIHSLTMRDVSIGGVPYVSREGRGIHSLAIRDTQNCNNNILPKNQKIYDWFRFLSQRFRYVRVVCGDWSRVCGGDWQILRNDKNVVGVFFDPPYGVKDRKAELYKEDGFTIAQAVEKWCLERGKRENYRIVVAGYTGEYEQLISNGWRVYRWSTSGGLGLISRGKSSRGLRNAKREMLLFSPYCNQIELL